MSAPRSQGNCWPRPGTTPNRCGLRRLRAPGRRRPDPGLVRPHHRRRLNRGGDRAANNVLHTIVLTRMRFDERNRAYVERRTRKGLSKKDIMRRLKRFVTREVYRGLTSTATEQITQTDLAPAA